MICLLDASPFTICLPKGVEESWAATPGDGCRAAVDDLCRACLREEPEYQGFWVVVTDRPLSDGRYKVYFSRALLSSCCQPLLEAVTALCRVALHYPGLVWFLHPAVTACLFLISKLRPV